MFLFIIKNTDYAIAIEIAENASSPPFLYIELF